MKLKVVTPDQILLTEEGVDFVRVDTPSGSIGILPSHAPLFTTLAQTGQVAYEQKGARQSLPIAGGVLHVLSDTITVMTQSRTIPSSV